MAVAAGHEDKIRAEIDHKVEMEEEEAYRSRGTSRESLEHLH